MYENDEDKIRRIFHEEMELKEQEKKELEQEKKRLEQERKKLEQEKKELEQEKKKLEQKKTTPMPIITIENPTKNTSVAFNDETRKAYLFGPKGTKASASCPATHNVGIDGNIFNCVPKKIEDLEEKKSTQ